VLILSRFAGAARELEDAIQVNPFCEEALADALASALSMPAEERFWRMATLRSIVQSNNVYKWAATILERFAEVTSTPTAVPLQMPHRRIATVA
jgi:trehalose-6-phosphate synthase